MKGLLLGGILGLMMMSCNYDNSSCGAAYFGGEIINPNSDHLVLYDSSQPIDTLYLDEDNRFSRKIENLNPGIYSFVHGGEYQVVLIEPGDSIMIRLNTFDFDESLVFTGKGAKKNNYLIGLFVQIEDESKMVYEMGKMDPPLFLAKLDSIRDKKREKLDAFSQKYQGSKLFRKVTNACIDYSYYAQKEIYPFRYFGPKYVAASSLPENYYDFRKEVDYNEEDLKDFYPYYNFLFPHFNNLALETKVERTGDTNFDRYSAEFNLLKLELIDSLVTNDPIKNNLLKYSTRNFLTNSASIDGNEAVHASFSEKCTNPDIKSYIDDVYGNLKQLERGNPFPDVELVDVNKRAVSINTLFDRPTVVFFWTKANRRHSVESHERVKMYKENYPDIKFISVNVNAQNYNSWRRLMGQNKFSLEHEYMLRNPEIAKRLLALHNIYKVMIVDSDKTIISGNTNMFSPEFGNQLTSLTKGLRVYPIVN